MPKRKRNELSYLGLRTRGGAKIGPEETKGTVISLEGAKESLLEIEALYTGTMKDMNREWELPDVREQILNSIQQAENVQDFYKLFDRVEQCFADPFQITYKTITEGEPLQESQKDEEDVDMED